MFILALDTTTRTASCALASDGAVLREEAADPSRQLALQLPRVLQVLLDRAGVALSDIDAFAVATGPGSFTGMRMGIATMQGLAFAAGKPLLGVSALDALAATAINAPDWPGGERTLVATWIDAWRGDVYAASYLDGHTIGEPVVAKPVDLLDVLGDTIRPGMAVFIGDGAATYRDLIVTAVGDAARVADAAAPLLAGTIAQLATDAYRAGHRPPPEAIRPLYVRRPDPELARERAGLSPSPVK